MQEKEYIAVLCQSLDKKVKILDLLIEKNKEQRIFFSDQDTTPEAIEQNMDEKAQLVERLEKLDEGFEQIYERVKTVLHSNKDAYREEVKDMQNNIKRITEKLATIRAQEVRNHELAGKRFDGIKKQIRQVRTSNKAATQYYKSMANLNVVDAQLMDKKK